MRATSFFLWFGRWLAVVEHVPAALQIGVAYEGVFVERRLADQVAGVQQLRANVDVGEGVERIAHGRLVDVLDRAEGNAHDDTRAIADRRGSEDGNEEKGT